MKLYLVEKQGTIDYDQYDSIIVAAKSSISAKRISPDEYHVWRNNNWSFVYADGYWDDYWDDYDASFTAWDIPNALTAEYLGEAKLGIKEGLILASFNAG